MHASAVTLLRQAMADYPEDPTQGDFLIRFACTQAANPLPLQRIAYKFYNRQRRFDLARSFAHDALMEAGRRAGLPNTFAAWTRGDLERSDDELASHVRLALKALAFINLRAGDEHAAKPYLTYLTGLDPEDGSGVSVIAALMDSVEAL